MKRARLISLSNGPLSSSNGPPELVERPPELVEGSESADRKPALDRHSGLGELLENIREIVGGDCCRETQQDGGLEAGSRTVECSGPDAMVGRDPADVDLRDLTSAEPLDERLIEVVSALETGVRRLELALEEDGVEVPEGQVRVPV